MWGWRRGWAGFWARALHSEDTHLEEAATVLGATCAPLLAPRRKLGGVRRYGRPAVALIPILDPRNRQIALPTHYGARLERDGRRELVQLGEWITVQDPSLARGWV